MLLLHGLGVDGSSWQFQLRALAEAGYRPIAIDIPGFGESKFLGKRWTFGSLARELETFLYQSNVNQAVVAGISMGGVLALQFSLDFPERVKQLVLINTFASLRPDRLDQLMYLGSRFVIANIRGIEFQAGLVARRLFPQEEQAAMRKELIDRILKSDPAMYRSAMRSLALFDARRKLPTIKIPTLVISGERDTTVRLENQRELVRGIAGARHVVVADAGHAVIVDQPEIVNQEMIRFIKEE